MKKILFTVAALCLFSDVAAQASTVYRWTGPRGGVHLGDSPPIGLAYAVVDPATGAIVRQVAAPQAVAAARQADNRARGEAEERAAADLVRERSQRAFLTLYPNPAVLRADFQQRAALPLALLTQARADYRDAADRLAGTLQAVADQPGSVASPAQQRAIAAERTAVVAAEHRVTLALAGVARVQSNEAVARARWNRLHGVVPSAPTHDAPAASLTPASGPSSL